MIPLSRKKMAIISIGGVLKKARSINNGCAVLSLKAEEKITGVIPVRHFDAGASNLPASTAVNLRLSSEGQCVFNNGITGNLVLNGTPTAANTDQYVAATLWNSSASPATFDNNTASWSSINSATWTSWATTPTLTNVTVGSTPAKSFNIPGTPYPQNGLWIIAEVRAVNAIGTSPISLQRPNTVDISFPTDGSQSGDGFIKFNYHLTYDGNSPILRYEYAVLTSANPNPTWVNMNTTSDAQPFTATGLANGVAYTVRVRAVNASPRLHSPMRCARRAQVCGAPASVRRKRVVLMRPAGPRVAPSQPVAAAAARSGSRRADSLGRSRA